MLDKLTKHPFGYFEVQEKPSQEELDQDKVGLGRDLIAFMNKKNPCTS